MRFAVASILLLLLACSDSTGPSYVDYSIISIINTATGTVSAEIDLDDITANQMCISPDGNYLYLSNTALGDGSIVQIDCLEREIIDELDLTGSGSVDVCINELGTELYAGSIDRLFIIDTPSLTVKDSVCSEITGLYRIEHRPGTDLVYASYFNTSSNYGIYVIDIAQCEVTDTLDFRAYNFAFSDDGNDLYIADGSNLKRLDPDLGHQIASIDLNTGIGSICMNPASNTIIVSTSAGLTSIDENTFLVQGSVTTDYDIGHLCYIPVLNNLCGSAEYDKVVVFDLPAMSVKNEIAVLEGLHGITADPSGDYIYCSIEYGIDN